MLTPSPLQISLDPLELEPRKEAWRPPVHGVQKSQTRLSGWTELNWWDLILTSSCSFFWFYRLLFDYYSRLTSSMCFDRLPSLTRTDDHLPSLFSLGFYSIPFWNRGLYLKHITYIMESIRNRFVKLTKLKKLNKLWTWRQILEILSFKKRKILFTS